MRTCAVLRLPWRLQSHSQRDRCARVRAYVPAVRIPSTAGRSSFATIGNPSVAGETPWPRYRAERDVRCREVRTGFIARDSATVRPASDQRFRLAEIDGSQCRAYRSRGCHVRASDTPFRRCSSNARQRSCVSARVLAAYTRTLVSTTNTTRRPWRCRARHGLRHPPEVVHRRTTAAAAAQPHPAVTPAGDGAPFPVIRRREIPRPLTQHITVMIVTRCA